MRKLTNRWAMIALVAGLVLSGCGRRSSGPTIIVGNASSPEQRLLGQLTSLMLEDAGFGVVERTNLGTGVSMRRSLETGEIDLCWDYTATAWEIYLGHDRPIADSHELYDRMRTEDALHAIAWLPPAPARGEMGIITTRNWAYEQDIYSLVELAEYINTVNPNVRLCAPEKDLISSRGIHGLERVYGFRFDSKQIVYGSLEEGYQSLAKGECDCALGNLVQAAISAGKVIMFNDGQSFYPASNLCLAIRSETLHDYPTLEAPLRRLASELTTQNLIDLQRLIEVDEQEIKTVAKRFLKENALIGKQLTPTP